MDIRPSRLRRPPMGRLAPHFSHPRCEIGLADREDRSVMLQRQIARPVAMTAVLSKGLAGLPQPPPATCLNFMHGVMDRRVQYLFGDCVLDLDRRELTRGSGAVAIGPQVFDLLVYLVQNRERVVSKDDLLDAVWGGRIVSESTLTSHINAVRKAIGDSGEEQRLIRTVARKGFRFVGDVRRHGRRRRRHRSTPSRQNRMNRRTCADPSRQALHCRPAVPEPERRSRAGLLRRRHGGGHHHGAVAHPLAVRHRAQLELHLQGPGGGREAGRPRAGRALRAGRQRAQGREPGAHHRTAHRCDDRRASVGGAFRRHARRHLRAAGPGHRERRRRDRAEAGAGRDRAREAQADRKPRRLRLLSARHGEPPSRDQGGHRRGAAAVLQGDRARSRFRVGLRRWRRGAISGARSTAG